LIADKVDAALDELRRHGELVRRRGGREEGMFFRTLRRSLSIADNAQLLHAFLHP
jgi:hypothetical protein